MLGDGFSPGGGHGSFSVGGQRRRGPKGPSPHFRREKNKNVLWVVFFFFAGESLRTPPQDYRGGRPRDHPFDFRAAGALGFGAGGGVEVLSVGGVKKPKPRH